MGEWLTVWTVRSSLAIFALCLAIELLGAKNRWFWQWRVAWTAGFGLMLCHVAAAFQFYHHWSHQAAYQSTAEQTRELLGISVGAGVYFNYLFLVVWAVDIFVSWMPAETFSRGSTLKHSMRLCGLAYLLFIAVNATVVFERGMVRWGGAISASLLMAIVLMAAFKRKARIYNRL